MPVNFVPGFILSSFIGNSRLAWKAIVDSDPSTEEIIFDKKGKDGALRVAVSVKDTVHMSNIFDTAKELHIKGKDEKNLTEVQMAAKKKQLFQNHESEAAADSTGLASVMVRASGAVSAGNAFSGHSIDISLDDLVPKVQVRSSQWICTWSGSEISFSCNLGHGTITNTLAKTLKQMSKDVMW